MTEVERDRGRWHRDRTRQSPGKSWFSIVARRRHRSRLVPTRRRSEFISEAVQAKLDHLKQERAVRAAAGVWSSEGRADPGDEIQALRSAWRNRTERLGDDGG